MNSKIKIEIVCENPTEVSIASKYDIDRIELSSSLHDFGLTPTLGNIQLSLQASKVPIVCSVRHRTGGFVYSDDEFNLALFDAKLILETGVSGLVFGFLTEDFDIDIEQTKRMTQLCHSFQKEAVFHRAFDVVNNQESALHVLEKIKIDRIITSGGYTTALEGKENLKKLVDKHTISILAGGGITSANVEELIEDTGINQIHSSCKLWIDDKGSHPMIQQAVSNQLQLGKLRGIDETELNNLVVKTKGYYV